MLSITAHAHFLIYPPQVVASASDGLISMLLIRYVAGWDPVIIILLYHALVLIQALRLNYLFNDHRMFNTSTYLVAMVYVLVTAILPEWNQLTPALVANNLVIGLFAKVLKLYNNPNPKTLLFNIGLIIGACILMYHPTTLLILIAIFALMVVRPFNIAEWLVMLMGVAAPYYFLFAFLFLTERWSRLAGYVPRFQLNLPDAHTSILFFVTLGVILLVLLAGVYQFQDKSRRMLIHVRKNWGVLVVMLLVMLPLPFISRNATFDSLLLWAIPVSPFIAMGFLSPKKNLFPNIMFWSLLILVVLNNWRWVKI